MAKRERPSWDEYFIGILIQAKKRSSCLKRQVGALIVKDHRVLTTGYNGATSGVENCFDNGFCYRAKEGIPHGRDKDLCLAAHAEQNAIYQAARYGISIDGAELYVTTFPCPTCAKAITQTGLVRINYLEDYYGKQHDFSVHILQKGKIKTRKLI